MQTQKSKENSLATDKQRKFIQSLQKRGFVDLEIDPLSLSVKEASSVIDEGLLLAKEAALSNEGHDEVSKETSTNSTQREEFNAIRFGMCAKLVYSKQDFNLVNAQGLADFKNEVRRLYKVLSEMEGSFAPSSSSSRVELLHSYMKKHNIPTEAD